jgi:hypothetical protein
MPVKTSFLLFIVVSLFSFTTSGQYMGRQYFDGADTTSFSIKIELEEDSNNIWQIGPPQKPMFFMAASFPNVLVTDTVNSYPPNNTSSFNFTLVGSWYIGILAIRWKQKLDMDAGQDGGKIEFSLNTDTVWKNVFHHPEIYNFYGFQAENVDTLADGSYAFTGTDSSWRDVWLCFDISYLALSNDTLRVRFTFSSDSIDNGREGWMIDNLFADITYQHTINEVKAKQYLSVYPNPSGDVVHIQAEKLQEGHIIEYMYLYNSLGQLVDKWKNIPTKYFFDARKYPNGKYYLSIRTNKKAETIPFVIHHR